MKAEAYEHHVAVWAPLSQFILPHVADHVRAEGTDMQNSSLFPQLQFLAAMHNDDTETWVNTQV